MPLLPLFGNPAGGGGGGGGNPPPSGGFGGGPGTYTLPAGLSLKQKKAMAALLACAPCCLGSGSGSGSSGSGVFVPCSVLQSAGGSTITLDWQVDTCFASSDTGVAWTGAACSSGSLFNAGTGNIFSGADTTFDADDLGGPAIEFQWCDGENTLWVSNADYSGLIEFAFCCMDRTDGSSYLAFYALLTLSCSNGVPAGTTLWAYKSRDIAYVPGDPFILSITGLTPFATTSSGAGCSCGGSPALSIALTVDTP